MRKKWLAACMAVCMMVSFAACADQDVPKEAQESSADAQERADESKGSTEEAGQTANAPETAEASEADSDDETSLDDETVADKETPAGNGELPLDAEYANLPESEGFVFESNGDGTCTLKELGACSDTDVVIPEKSPEGDTVTEIAEYAFYEAEDISSIIFAGRTMELDEKAFQSCGAEKLVISGSELTIGGNAFSYCDKISSISISNSVVNVDEYALYDSGKDMEVIIENTTGELKDKAFQACGLLNLTIKDSELEIGENAFSYCEDLQSVLFENSKGTVGTYAFYDSCDDAAVAFTGCKMEIDDKAFQACGVVTLTVADSETVMGENAFSYCEDLTDVAIGANNTEVGSYAFYDCTALANVSIAAESEDDSIRIMIADNAFQSCAVQSVVIGRGEVELGENAFSYCENLTGVQLKGSSLKVGDYAFYDCPDELVITYSGMEYNKESIEEVQ